MSPGRLLVGPPQVADVTSRDNVVTVALLQKFVTEPEDLWLEAWRSTPICHQLPEEEMSFFFYASLLERYQIHLPLSDFQQSSLSYLKIAPSQVAPTGWGFLKGFEALMKYLGKIPSERVFMTQFEVFKPFKDCPKNTRFVDVHNNQTRAFFEAATDSNKGFKSHYFLVRAQSGTQRAGRAKMNYPCSWSREQDVAGYRSLNLQPKDLEGEERETFELLQAWGSRMKRGLKKFLCDDIIKKGAESPEALRIFLG